MKPELRCAELSAAQCDTPKGGGVCSTDGESVFHPDSYSKSGADRLPRTQDPSALHTLNTLGSEQMQIDPLALVGAVFPGARLTRRRTSEEHAALWLRLTRRAEARRQSESLATARLEQLLRNHGDAS